MPSSLTDYLPFMALAYTGMTQAGAQSDLADFQGAQLDSNSIIARMQASRALQVGGINENRSRIATRQLIGTQRANMAAQGIDVNRKGDSSIDVQADTAGLGELDALTIRNNAALAAWGFNVQANDLSAQANMKRTAGGVSSRGTLITTGMQALKFLPKDFGSSWLADTPAVQGVETTPGIADLVENIME